MKAEALLPSEFFETKDLSLDPNKEDNKQNATKKES
jgi:hypothetical protein